MNILIGGGFGFIGSYLTPSLLGTGMGVGVIARRVPTTFEDIAAQVDCYLHDLSEPHELRLRQTYDAFVHLAGALHSTRAASPDLLARTVEVTRHSLGVCRANDISRFIHFSTFQVYGSDHGYIDEDTPIDCRNDYALAHHLAEEEVRRASREGGPDYVIVRPTNCFGFSAHTDVYRWSLVPGCFCRSAVDDREIVLRTSGLQQKDFIHLEQVASLTRSICSSFDRFRNQPVNLASGCALAIVDVARMVQAEYCRMTGSACDLRVMSESPPRLEPLAISRARTADLPYVPTAGSSLSADITRTLSFLAS